MMMSSGILGRWCFGIIILTNLIVYNEGGNRTIFVAAVLSMFCSFLMAYSKAGLSQIQIAYLRASHRIDFVCLFTSLWMKLLALVATDAAVIRTISHCLDSMSGGLVRIYILGRNSSINEPWPDVVGVIIVFLISFMFIMGLENSKIFTFLMISGVVLISSMLIFIVFSRVNAVQWTNASSSSQGLSDILSASALLVISFPNSMIKSEKYSKIKTFLLFVFILFSIFITAGCLSFLITSDKSSQDYEAVPILRLLESINLKNLISAMSCLYIITSSGILLEIFPETYEIIVILASSDWRILLKQIGYENRETGSPILAIFVCGSLVCILTFACPLQNLTFIIAGAQLLHGCFVALFFLYYPYRPKVMLAKNESSSSSYSRLDTNDSSEVNLKSSSLVQKKSSWFLSKTMPLLSTQNISKSINVLNHKADKKEEEREWLLLGEPSSPIVRVSTQYQKETSIGDDTNALEDDCIVENKTHQAADSESSEDDEDIDSIVEEYQQTMKISTTGLKETTLKVPSHSSWRFSQLVMAAIFGMCALGAYEINNGSMLGFLLSLIITLTLSFISLFIPRYYSTFNTPSSLICTISIYFISILLSSIMFDSWLALIFWIISGLILALQSLIKCDIFCCLCLNYYPSDTSSSEHTAIVMEENIMANCLAPASINIQNPPKCLSVVNHVQKFGR